MIVGSAAKQAQYWMLTQYWNQNVIDVPWRQYRDINVYGYYPKEVMEDIIRDPCRSV
jgi:hypothetical protein